MLNSKWTRPSEEAGGGYVAFLDNPPPPQRVALLAERQRRGLHLRTGLPLTDLEADEWVRAWAGLSERWHKSGTEEVEWEPRAAVIVEADDRKVIYRNEDGQLVAFIRTVTTVLEPSTKKPGKLVKKRKYEIHKAVVDSAVTCVG